MSENAIEIGEWTFFPAAAELRRGDERRALEDRAARLLTILARERGAVVSHDQLVAEVWRGRTVSPNSIAVVIGDLRRALDDNARAPKHIETVAKRGYRLTPSRAVATSPPRRQLILAGAGAALLVVVAATSVFSRLDAAAPPAIAVAEVANETGDERYAPLARAVTELVVADATRGGAFAVRRGGEHEAAIAVSGRLVLWSGHPSVSLSATDTQTGEVIWSGIAPGPEDSLPGQVRGLMDEFSASVEPRR